MVSYVFQGNRCNIPLNGRRTSEVFRQVYIAMQLFRVFDSGSNSVIPISTTEMHLRKQQRANCQAPSRILSHTILFMQRLDGPQNTGICGTKHRSRSADMAMSIRDVEVKMSTLLPSYQNVNTASFEPGNFAMGREEDWVHPNS
jgi:hypothetical protein